MKQLLDNKINSYTMEKRFIKKDGFAVWTNLTVSLIRSTSGEPRYSIGVIEDIDEKRKLQAALRQAIKWKPLAVWQAASPTNSTTS